MTLNMWCANNPVCWNQWTGEGQKTGRYTQKKIQHFRNWKIKDCTQKREKLQEVVSLNNECVEYSMRATDQDDAAKIKKMLVKGHGMKGEEEKIENGISKLDRKIVLLLSKRKGI